MGFFSSSEPAPAALPQLNQDRMKALFDREEWKYFVDSDGDMGGIWDNEVFYFMLRGEMNEILHVQGRSHHELPSERLEEVREFINAWNRDKFWPKAYYRVTDEGKVILFGDFVVDYEDGVSDDQLLQTLRHSIGTSMQLFEAAAEEFAN